MEHFEKLFEQMSQSLEEDLFRNCSFLWPEGQTIHFSALPNRPSEIHETSGSEGDYEEDEGDDEGKR